MTCFVRDLSIFGLGIPAYLEPALWVLKGSCRSEWILFWTTLPTKQPLRSWATPPPPSGLLQRQRTCCLHAQVFISMPLLETSDCKLLFQRAPEFSLPSLKSPRGPKWRAWEPSLWLLAQLLVDTCAFCFSVHRKAKPRHCFLNLHVWFPKLLWTFSHLG